RSFSNLLRVDAGFDRTNLTTFSVALPPRPYADTTRRVAFFDDLIRQVAAVPGVTGATAMSGLPPRRELDANDTKFEGYVPPPNSPPSNTDYFQYATPSYFATMRIPILRGRGFGSGDAMTSAPVVIINEALAKHYYENQDPIGRRIQLPGKNGFFTI